MMLGLKSTPLFLLGASLVILPAFVYGIPINTVDLPTVPQVDGLEKPFLTKLDVPVPKKPLLSVPTGLQPLVDDAGLSEKFEKIVPEQQLPLLSVNSTPLVNNTNLLPENFEEVVPLVVVATIVHIDNLQILIPRKFSEKPLSLVQPIVGLPGKLEGIVPEQLSLVLLDSLPLLNNIDVLTEKLEKVVPETLNPLAFIASIPQIGNIEIVFSEELLNKLLLKKVIYLVPVEAKPEVGDVTVLLTILAEIVPEKPFYLVPGKLQEPFAVIASIPHIGNVQLIFSGELLGKLLSKKLLSLVDVESKFQYSGVTTLPGTLLGEIVTEKLLLLDPVESTLTLEKIGLETYQPLDVVPLIPQFGNLPALPSGELLDKISTKKLLPLLPVGNVAVLPELVKGTLHEKTLPLVPISQDTHGDVLVPDVLTSGVVNEVSTVLLVITTPTPVLELTTNGKLD